ncbi:MAG: hypothetical protein ACXV8Q_13590 [Methylobacter sp.]
MLSIKSKKFTLPLCLCVMSALLFPMLAQAEPAMVLAASDTGNIAASKAADQKAALAKKAAERQKAADERKAAEELKAAEENKKKATEK